MPVRTAVEPMRLSCATPVRIVNREVLPTIGRPIIAVFIREELRFRKGSLRSGARRPPLSGWPLAWRAANAWRAQRGARAVAPRGLLHHPEGRTACLPAAHAPVPRDRTPGLREGSRPAPVRHAPAC